MIEETKLVNAYSALSNDQKSRFFPGGLEQAERVVAGLQTLIQTDYATALQIYITIAVRVLMFNHPNERIRAAVKVHFQDLIPEGKMDQVINFSRNLCENHAFLAPEQQERGKALNAMLDKQNAGRYRANKAKLQDAVKLDGFGLSPENPVYAHLADGSYGYLNKLWTKNRIPITWNRLGSYSGSSEDPIDKYQTYLPNGEVYGEVYVNMYSDTESPYYPLGYWAKNLQLAPASNKNKAAAESKKSTVANEPPVISDNTIRISYASTGGDTFKYCPYCGAPVPPKAKFCISCGSKLIAQAPAQPQKQAPATPAKPKNNESTRPVTKQAPASPAQTTKPAPTPVSNTQTEPPKKTGRYVLGAIAAILLIAFAFWGINSSNISKQARAIDEKIASINVTSVNDRDTVTDVRAEYDSLDEKVKAKVQNLALLEESETKVSVLEADSLIRKIGEVDLDAGDRIDAARAAFDAVEPESRSKITSRNDLFTAEETYQHLVEEANAAHVSELIANMGKVTLENMEEIQAVSEAYAALTATEKELVEGTESLQKAEERLNNLIIDQEYNTAHALVEKKNYNEAIRSIESFANTNDGVLPDKLVKELAHAYVLIARDYEKDKHYEAAEKTLKECCNKYARYSAFQEANDAKKSLDKKLMDMIPSNGKVFDSTAKGGDCELTIQNGGSPAFIKFENIYDSNQLITMYVGANQTATVNVKDGTYRLKYATGSKWYGEVDLFGKNTSYYKADTTETLKTQIKGNMIHYQTLTITLYTVYDGNLSTSEIPESQF